MANGYRGFWRLNRRKSNVARRRRQHVAMQLGHESLEQKKLLAVTPSFAAGQLLFVDDATGVTANTVSIFMGDATGSTVSYSINGGALATQAGVTSIRFQDDAADAGDTLELYGFNGSAIAISGTSLSFGAALPITTASVEHIVVDGGDLRSPVTLDDKSVTGDVTVRNASTTTIGGSGVTAVFEVGGSVSIESLSVSLPGQIDAGGDVTIDSHDTSTLVGQITSRTGSVTIESLIGSLDMSANTFLIATLDPAAGDVTLRSHCGTVVVEQVCAAGDVLIEGELGVVVEQIVDGATATIVAECGFADLAQLCIDVDVVIQAGLNVTLDNVISSETGNITIASTNGSIALAGAAMLHAMAGSIDISATQDIIGEGGSVSAVTVVAGGTFYEYANVTIAPPASGLGRAARASAVISPVVIDPVTGLASGGVITAINVIDPGFGYANGEQAEVTIEGSPSRTVSILTGTTTLSVTIPAATGAQAFATATLSGSIIAADTVTVSAGFDISLGLPVVGDTAAVSSTFGNIALDAVRAEDDVTIFAKAGSATVVDLYAGKNITVSAAREIGIAGLLQADAGTISVQATSGDIDVAGDGKVHAVAGDVSLSSVAGAIDATDILAGGNIALTAAQAITIAGIFRSDSGDIAVTSKGGGINVMATVTAQAVSFDAKTFVKQSTGTGIETVTIVQAGIPEDDFPAVIVTIAPPRSGGSAATARAVIRAQSLGRDSATGQQTFGYVLDSILITDPGQGYALGENPIVTIEGGFKGAIALATGPTDLRTITADNGISVVATDDITLVNALTATKGDVTITSGNGFVDLSSPTALIAAAAGSVSVTSQAGSVVVQAVYAAENVAIDGDLGAGVVSAIHAGKAISISSDVGNVKVAGELLAESGSITLASTSGGVDLAANLNAGDELSITAHGGIDQTAGSGLRRIDLLSAGESTTASVPRVIVSVAAPSGGGVAATAFARLETFSNAVGQTRYRISAIEIITPGSGYAIGETPDVQITSAGTNGINGAAALAVGPTGFQNLVAQNDVSIKAGDNISLLNTIRSTTADIVVSSIDGDIDIGGAESLLHSPQGSITVDAEAGFTKVYSASALRTVTIDGEMGATVLTSVNSGTIEVSAGLGNVDLKGLLTATTGNLTIESRSASVTVAANLEAKVGGIGIRSAGGMQQTVASGLREVQVLFGGESEGTTVPTVDVAIARPAAGGVAAKAFAKLRGFTNPLGFTRYTVDEIIITDPGRGYVIGERPEVTIDGVVGAAAIAFGPIGYQNIVANGDVTIEAISDVILTNTVQSQTGDVVVSTSVGNLNMGNSDLLLHAVAGSVFATSQSGFIDAERINAAEAVVIASQSRVALKKEIISGTGDISVVSRSGTIFLTANIAAENAGISLIAHQGVLQTAQSGVSEIKILAPGTFVGQAAPNVVVTIAPPAGGGIQATAEALTAIIGYTTDDNPIPLWGLQEIIITNPGEGYAIGENPLVTFTGGISGAVAVAVGPTGAQNITAEGNISITAGDSSRLVSIVRSIAGNISIVSSDGDLDLGSVDFIAQAETGSVTISGGDGGLTIRSVDSAGSASISADGRVDILGSLSSLNGDVSVTSKNGDLDFTAADALIFADLGGVALTSLNGSILSPPVLNVGRDVAITSFSTIRLNNEVTSTTGTIAVKSSSGGISLGTNIVANADSITLTAKSEVTQLGRGIAAVKILSGGRNYTSTTRIAIAPPTAGGVTARARPILGRSGAIIGIQIINPGSGYGVGEEVEVTITGAGAGASAVAYASSVLQNISAAKNVAIDAGAGITLLNTVSTLDGDISLTANVGDIDLRTDTVKLSAKNGSVSISTFTGAILSPPALHVTNNITLQSSAALSLANELTAATGDITLRSTSGGVSLANNVFAGDRITLDANAGILQTKGFVQAEELVVANKSALPVILGAQENNVDRFAGTSVGGITYIDADSFETGVNRVGVQLVEVTTNGALTLQAGTSSSGPLRIVGGVTAAPNQLFLSSGSAAIPGEVEYVVTNKQSAGPLSFRGTLANMIRLSNLNQARFDGAVVPQTIVFDADGYVVETVTLNAALPLVTQPVTIDGTATESSVAIERVEITRGATSVVNGLSFAAGSAGSEVTGLSVTGFSTGAGISLLSGGSAVTDTFVGVQRDGSTIKTNLVGIDISGTTATGNVVGGVDDDDANIIGGNTFGVRVRNRAAENLIAGNYIGTNDSDTKLGNTEAGVLVTGATSTLVSENTISNNKDGIRLNAATATTATANRIELNRIVGNTGGAGVRVAASSFAVVGGIDAGNVIGQNGVGIVIAAGSTGNVVAGNFIGTDEDGTDLGNSSDGVQVVASIGNTIGGATEDFGNAVANNGGSGIAIRNSVASSAALGNKVFANLVTGNSIHGILIEGGTFHSVGSNADTGNTVALNAGDGIRVQSFGRTASSRNLIRGNLVGTDSRIADIDMGNAGDGIAIVGGSLNRVDLGNVVRFNAGNGVRVEGSSSNFIGSDVADEGNQIRDNLANGIVITGGPTNMLARDNAISGNLIDRNGTPPVSATTGNGVLVSGNRTVNTVIGTRVVSGRLVGQGNEILDNAGFGVSVEAGASNVQIQGNEIAENGLGPVHISGSANLNVATPTIKSALLHRVQGTAAQLVVEGSVPGPLGQQLAIDIYCTPAVNITPGLPDYGRRHIGRLTVTITEPLDPAIRNLGDPGFATFTVTLAIEEAATGDRITGTATTMSAFTGSNMFATPIGSTSRFSSAVALGLPPTVSSISPTRQTRRI